MSHRRFLPVYLAAFGLFFSVAGFSQQAASAPEILSIEVQYAGSTKLSREKVLANMQTRKGRPYDERTVEEDIRNLYATGNVTNVRIYGQPTPAGVNVIVVIQAKPQIEELGLQGVEKLKESRVRKQLSVKVGDGLNEALLEADRQKILEYYRGKGYSEVDVRTSVDTDEKEGKARVAFRVSEGSKLEVRSVKFEGNQVVAEKDLKRAVKTKPRNLISFLTNTGRLDRDQLDQDAIAIRELYQSRGYVDAEVDPAQVESVGGRVDVTFRLREGQMYHVGNVTYRGNRVFTPDEILAKIKTKSGEVYSPQRLRADVKAVQDLYGTRGYVDFQAVADTIPAGSGMIDVAFRFEEGTQSYVEHVNVTGNVRTKDKVIRRELALAPGEVFNTVRLDASRQRLQGLNYFSKVEAYPSDTLVPGRKDVNVNVEEKRTGSVNFGAGFSSIDSLLAFAELTQSNFDALNWPNFTGGGQKFRIRAQYGTRRQDFIISLTEPYFLDQKISLGGELFYRDASFVSSVYAERRYGFELNSRKSLNEFTFVRAGYRFEDVNIHDVDPDAPKEIQDSKRSFLQSMLSAGITYDTRDSLMLTRRGERLEFQTYGAGGPLGGDVQIYGFSLEGAKYFNLAWDTILILNAEVANVDTWGGGSSVPIFDRLYLGGANNLRGFRYRDVGPKDSSGKGEPIGGSSLVRGTVEYTMPVMDKVRAAVFYDVGAVNSKSYSFGGNLNSDVGVGLRLDLPIGPVRIDYGIPMAADKYNDGGGRFNFNVGYQF